MSEPRVALTVETISKQEIDSLRDWLGTYPRLTKGQVTLDFEKKWSQTVGMRHSTFVNSGSSAILLVLSAMIAMGKIDVDDAIVVPALSWLTDVSSPMNLGLRPILCDANREDLSLDLDKFEQIVVKESPKVAIVVSVLGLSPNMERLKRICDRYGVLLIEDVCESLGTDFDGEWLGTFGYASLYSLYYGHHISTIEGGMVCTDDAELDAVVRSMRSHGWNRDWSPERAKRMDEKWQIDPFQSKYTFFYPGYNLRATDLQAFIGLKQVDRIGEISEKRHDNFILYESLLGDINTGIDLSAAIKRSNRISNFAYPIVFHDSKERSFAATLLDYAGIESRPLIAGSMANQPFMKRAHVIQDFSSPYSLAMANYVHTCGMYLPNNHTMGKEEIELVASVLDPIRQSRKRNA